MQPLLNAKIALIFEKFLFISEIIKLLPYRIYLD